MNFEDADNERSFDREPEYGKNKYTVDQTLSLTEMRVTTLTREIDGKTAEPSSVSVESVEEVN